jgi:hypothetical protein
METTLRDALHETVHNGGVPMKRLSDQLGISYSYLANAANPNLDDFNFQLRHVMPLINATGNYAVLDHLENACGRVAFCLPQAGKDHLEITQGLLELVGRMGDLSHKMREILADGKVDEQEYKRVEPVFFGMLQEIAGLMASTAQAVRR